MIVGRVSEHQGAFVGQIHIHNSFTDGANRNVGFGFGNGQRSVDVNVHFVFGFDDRENGFGSQFGQTGFALVVFQTVFVFAQTNGDVAVGVVKRGIGIAGGAGAFLYDIFCRMNGNFG